MKNPPAFQFYPQDFISDLNVQSMTDDEVGKYVKLLCHCWIEDGLKNGSPLVDQWFKQHPVLRLCFVKKGGVYRNPRLDREREKQRRWSEKSAKGGAKRARNKEVTTKALPKPNQTQPNANQGAALQSSSSILRDKNKSYLFLSDLLVERVKVNVPFQKIPANYQNSWSNEFRLMVEADKIPIERVKVVLDWATRDSFWKNNIRSASKFREQFGQLEAKSRSTGIPDAVARERRVGANNVKVDPRAKAEIDALADRIFGEARPRIEAARDAGKGADALKIEEEAQRAYEKEAAVIARKYWKPQGEARP